MVSLRLKISLIVMVMLTMSLPTMAASNYYSKAVATAVGEGKVYASKSKTDNPAYVEGSSEATNSGTSASHTYYLYAQADEGSEFAGWYDNAQCSGDAVSTESPYTAKITASSTTQANPTTITYYAKFRKAGAPVLNYGEAHVYVNISEGTYKNETLTTENITEAITYESSNENVATVAADGTVTVLKRGSCLIKAKSGEAEGAYILTVIDDVTAGITQIGNSDFEDWRGVTSSNHAPDNWNSFETNEGSYASLARSQQVQMVEGGRPGSDGLYCVDIYSRSVLGVVAQGNLTTGCINAGATSATNKANYNYSKTSDPKKSETISKIPSAIKLWVRFVPAAINNQHPNAHVAVTVHSEYNYITYSDPSYEDDANLNSALAHALYDFPACDWTEVTIPFIKTGNYTDGQMYILVNISTNADPGQGQAGDHLYVDDFELIYDDEPQPVVYDKYVSVGHEEPVEASIEVTYNDDRTIDFALKNFCLEGIGGVGNIAIPNLARDDEGAFSFEGDIQIAPGDKEGVEMWAGPLLGDIPLEMNGIIKNGYFYVHLNINISGAPVEVEVGDKSDATFKVGDNLIGTFCAPFTLVIPEAYRSFVTISTVTGAEENGVLILEPIEGGVVPANTPVVVEIPQAMEMSVSGIFVKGTPTVGLLTGVYADTSAPVGSYVLQNNNDVVGFYKVVSNNQPTIKANRCYLTAPASEAKAFFFNEDDATGIEETLSNSPLKGENIFNLAGQRIQKMQKGINIVNGKKVLF